MTPASESPNATPTPEVTVLPTDDNHRGNGKVARLPKVLRDHVNRMLDDGLSYKAIIEKLEQSTDPPLPYKLLEMNISRWKDNGYQRYLRHQEWRDDLRILRESGSEMTEFNDGPKFQETLTQIALTEIFRVLQQGELKPDSLNYIRLFNALARLNREALGLRKYNDLLAKEEAELKKLEIGRKMSPNEHRAIVDQADQIFRMPRPGPGFPSSSSSSSPEPRTSRRELRPEGLVSGETQIDGKRDVAPHPESSIEHPASGIRHPESVSPPSTPDSRPSCLSSPSTPDTRHSCAPSPSTLDTTPSEYCLDCHHPLPPLTPEGKRPNERCEQCKILLPPPGTCTRPSFDKCHVCGTNLPHRLPNGRRPKPACHNCGAHLGRETDDDIKKYAEE